MAKGCCNNRFASSKKTWETCLKHSDKRKGEKEKERVVVFDDDKLGSMCMHFLIVNLL